MGPAILSAGGGGPCLGKKSGWGAGTNTEAQADAIANSADAGRAAFLTRTGAHEG